MALTRQEAHELTEIDRADLGADPAFVAALRAGRPDAFRRLVESYQGPLYNVALRIVQDREDARDVVQEVFIKALRALPSTQGRLHVRAWLYRVTINASYDHLRAARRRPLPVGDLGVDRPSPVDEIKRAELSRVFGETLRALPARQKVALLLKDVHGLPHSEIAVALGISRGSAEVLLFRARHGFRRRFTALNGDGAGRQRCRLAEHEAAHAVGSGLPAARRRRLLEHARVCPDCRRTVEGWGDAAVGLAVAFPLVAFSEGTATAAAIGPAAAASGAGMVISGAGLGAAGGMAGAATAGAVAEGAALGGVLAKLATLAGVKTAAVVAGACVVTAGSVAGVELVSKTDGRPANAGQTSGLSSSSVVAVDPARDPARTAVVTEFSMGATTLGAPAAGPAAGSACPGETARDIPEGGGLAPAGGGVIVVSLEAGDADELSLDLAVLLHDGLPLSDELWVEALSMRAGGSTWASIAAVLDLDLVPYAGSAAPAGPGLWIMTTEQWPPGDPPAEAQPAGGSDGAAAGPTPPWGLGDESIAPDPCPASGPPDDGSAGAPGESLDETPVDLSAVTDEGVAQMRDAPTDGAGPPAESAPADGDGAVSAE